MKKIFFVILLFLLSFFTVYSDNELYVLTDLSETDPGNWLNTSTVYSVYALDSDNVYIVAEDGKFGRYSKTSNVLTDLSGIDPGNWLNTSEVFSVYALDSDNVYIAAAAGKFGLLEKINSLLKINIYDRKTDVLITSSSTVTIIATNGTTNTTTTGIFGHLINNNISENYQVIVFNDNYLTETVSFYYNVSDEYITKNLYLLNSTQDNAGYITLRAQANTGQYIENALCTASEWKSGSSSYVKVAEGMTNVNGRATLNIELANKQYVFHCEKDDIEKTTEGMIITTNALELPMIMIIAGTTFTNILNGLSGTLTNTTLNATHQRITFEWNDVNNLDPTGFLKVYTVLGNKKTLVYETNSTGSLNQIITDININSTSRILVLGSILASDDIIYDVGELWFMPSFSMEGALNEWGISPLLVLIIIISCMSIGLMISPQNFFISLIFIIGGAFFSALLMPSIMTFTIAIFISLVAILTIWGAQQ